MSEFDLTKKATILVADDTPGDLALISGLLKGDYAVKIANCGEKALSIAASGSPPDLILLDIMMPGMDGYEVCRRLKHDPKTVNIPVIFITAKTEEEDEKKGLELGAIDYITKPISPPIVLARVKNHLVLKAMIDFLRDQNDWNTAERLAFTLNGISGNVGATGLQQFAEKLNIAIKERRALKQADAGSNGLVMPPDNFITQLEQEFLVEQGRAAATADPEKLKVVCDKLKTLLADGDAEACEVMDENAELLNAAFPSHCHEIDNHIRLFDFDAALTALRAASTKPLVLSTAEGSGQAPQSGVEGSRQAASTGSGQAASTGSGQAATGAYT